jgi:glycosyltransferase involved in cell wall biosynthesis
MAKPRLLFITSVLPSATGGGSAMRAYQFIEAYSVQYEIALMLIDFGYYHKVTTSELSAFCSDIAIFNLLKLQTLTSLVKRILFRLNVGLYFKYFRQPSELRFVSKKNFAQFKACLNNQSFAIIHVFKFYLLPFALTFKKNADGLRIWLDMDDLEFLTRQRIANLYAANNNKKLAMRWQQDAEQYVNWQNRYIRELDRIYICSEIDKRRLLDSFSLATIKVVPNVLPVPRVTQEEPSSEVFTFLFIGNFNYYPNEDAIDYFCTDIMPLINARISQPIQVKVIGAGLNKSVQRKISSIANMQYLGYADTLVHLYATANTIIVPIRAGGGTRIKILEAFSHQRPVVTTTVGVEGIDAVHNQHVLIADTAQDFADQCLSLINNADLAANLASNAWQLFCRHYSTNSLPLTLIEQ